MRRILNQGASVALAALAALALGQSSARAGFTATIEISDGAGTIVTGSLPAGLSSVKFGNVFAGHASGAPFDQEQFQFFGPATLTVSDPTTFSFGSAGFGTFTGSSLIIQQVTSTSETFYVGGNFAVGTDPTYRGLTGGAASYIFTVKRATDGSYSALGTLSLPAASSAVPEPSSLVLCGIAGLTGVVMARKRRGRAA